MTEGHKDMVDCELQANSAARVKQCASSALAAAKRN